MNEMEEEFIKGRGSQYNTPNRFSKYETVTEFIEGLDEPLIQEVRTQVFFDYPKNIVNPIKSPDVGMQFSVNPYQGCEHGCIYCYARNTHEYWGWSAGLDFESKIMAKPDAALLLAEQLLGKNWNAVPIMLSGNTDCYQPQERKFQLTRQMLQVLSRYRHP